MSIGSVRAAPLQVEVEEYAVPETQTMLESLRSDYQRAYFLTGGCPFSRASLYIVETCIDLRHSPRARFLTFILVVEVQGLLVLSFQS